jgi:hypothetical protein
MDDVLVAGGRCFFVGGQYFDVDGRTAFVF